MPGGIPSTPGTPVAASQNAGNGALGVSMPAVAGKTNFCTGFEVTSGGATAGSLIQIALSGVIGGPFPYAYSIPAGATLDARPLFVEFNPPLPATGQNVAIQLAVPAAGAGNANTCAQIHGYVA